jgi:cobalamin biosynthesis protein CobT
MKTPPCEAAFSIRNAQPELHWAPSPQKADHGGDGEQNDRNEEDQLGDLDSGTGNAAKAKQSCDQSDDEKSDCPTEHGVTSHTDKSTEADDADSTPSETVRFRSTTLFGKLQLNLFEVFQEAS